MKTTLTKRFQPTLECLEERRLMTANATAELTNNGTLLVIGSNQNDEIVVAHEGNSMHVIMEGPGHVERWFDANKVKQLLVTTLGGDDQVTIEKGVDVPATLVAGDGNDYFVSFGRGDTTMFAGKGNDTLFGGDGNDTLYGGAGNTWFNGMGGNNAIHQGSGKSYWAGGTWNVPVLGTGSAQGDAQQFAQMNAMLNSIVSQPVSNVDLGSDHPFPAVPTPSNVSIVPTPIGHLISEDSSGIMGNNGSGIISDNGSGIMGNNGSGIIGQNGGNIMGNNGSGIIGQNGGNIMGNNGSGILGNNGGNFRPPVGSSVQVDARTSSKPVPASGATPKDPVTPPVSKPVVLSLTKKAKLHKLGL